MANEKQLTRAQVADAWAKITIKVWRENLTRLQVNRSNALWQSFMSYVTARADGDIKKIEFAFKYYGKFVDMGVGRGVHIKDAKRPKDNHNLRKVNMMYLKSKMLGSPRKPKKWYSKTLTHEVNRLAEILGVNYENAVISELTNGIENLGDNSIQGGARIKL